MRPLFCAIGGPVRLLAPVYAAGEGKYTLQGIILCVKTTEYLLIFFKSDAIITLWSAVFVVWEIRNPQYLFGSGPFAEIGKVCTFFYGKSEVSLRRTHLGEPGLILFHITAQADNRH